MPYQDQPCDTGSKAGNQTMRYIIQARSPIDSIVLSHREAESERMAMIEADELHRRFRPANVYVGDNLIHGYEPKKGNVHQFKPVTPAMMVLIEKIAKNTQSGVCTQAGISKKELKLQTVLVISNLIVISHNGIMELTGPGYVARMEGRFIVP